HQAGHWVWVEDNGRAVERDSARRALRMIGTRRDITSRRQHHEQERLAATVFEATSDGIFVLDPQRRILAVNQAFSVSPVTPRMTWSARLSPPPAPIL